MADISRNSISQPQFQLYDMETWERAEYFHYYMDLIKTRYNLNVNIDITGFMAGAEGKKSEIFPVHAVHRHAHGKHFSGVPHLPGQGRSSRLLEFLQSVLHRFPQGYPYLFGYLEPLTVRIFITFYETVVADTPATAT